jgi:hypothetical protein
LVSNAAGEAIARLERADTEESWKAIFRDATVQTAPPVIMVNDRSSQGFTPRPAWCPEDVK